MFKESSFTVSLTPPRRKGAARGEEVKGDFSPAETPSQTCSIHAGDWKDQSGLCFVDVPAPSSEVVAILEAFEDEVDGRAATRAFDDPTNADRISWDTLKQ